MPAISSTINFFKGLKSIICKSKALDYYQIVFAKNKEKRYDIDLQEIYVEICIYFYA